MVVCREKKDAEDPACEHKPTIYTAQGATTSSFVQGFGIHKTQLKPDRHKNEGLNMLELPF